MSRLNASWPPAEPVPFRPQRFLRTRRGLIMIGVVVVVVTIALYLVTRPTETDRMAAMPELYLTYPGAVVLREPSDAVAAVGDAEVRRLYGADASIETLEDWYREQLTSRGWEPGAGSSGGPARRISPPVAGTPTNTASCWPSGDRRSGMGWSPTDPTTSPCMRWSSSPPALSTVALSAPTPRSATGHPARHVDRPQANRSPNR